MLWLPPREADRLAERSRSYNEDVLRSCVVDDSDRLLAHYAELLRRIHPRLLMVRAQERIVPGVAMKPGYYHIIVRTETGPWNVTPIEGAEGEFVEPTGRVLEKLAEGDMRERRTLERWAENQRGEEIGERTKLERQREERQDHLHDLVNAYTRTSVSMTDAAPWVQNMQPHGRRARGEQGKK